MVVRQVTKSLPSIKAVIGHIPQHLRTEKIIGKSGRMHVLRRMVTNLVREERCELVYNRALEARPYMERLLQLAVYQGMDDPYVKEMTDWWIAEEDLREKLREVLVPRFQKIEEPFTNLYTLPKEGFISYKRGGNVKYRVAYFAVLELKGNPYPPVISSELSDNPSLLRNVLLRVAANRHLQAGPKLTAPKVQSA